MQNNSFLGFYVDYHLNMKSPLQPYVLNAWSLSGDALLGSVRRFAAGEQLEETGWSLGTYFAWLYVVLIFFLPFLFLFIRRDSLSHILVLPSVFASPWAYNQKSWRLYAEASETFPLVALHWDSKTDNALKSLSTLHSHLYKLMYILRDTESVFLIPSHLIHYRHFGYQCSARVGFLWLWWEAMGTSTFQPAVAAHTPISSWPGVSTKLPYTWSRTGILCSMVWIS